MVMAPTTITELPPCTRLVEGSFRVVEELVEEDTMV